jgi:hypothetical protein
MVTVIAQKLPALAPVAATRTGLKLMPVMNVRQIDYMVKVIVHTFSVSFLRARIVSYFFVFQ